MTDPIADFLIRIKNAARAGHETVVMPHSKMRQALADILVAEGYLTGAQLDTSAPMATLTLSLRYVGRQTALSDVRLLSKPGRRLYASVKEIPATLGGYGITIVSTSRGVMTGKQARKENVGGELICQVW